MQFEQIVSGVALSGHKYVFLYSTQINKALIPIKLTISSQGQLITRSVCSNFESVLNFEKSYEKIKVQNCNCFVKMKN